jgi:hypothetical protein
MAVAVGAGDVDVASAGVMAVAVGAGDVDVASVGVMAVAVGAGAVAWVVGVAESLEHAAANRVMPTIPIKSPSSRGRVNFAIIRICLLFVVGFYYYTRSRAADVPGSNE